MTGMAKYLIFVYVTVFFLILAFLSFSHPVVAYDTDLWYHLSDGRFIAENGTVPDNSYFSFLEPARNKINYAWLFKSLVYGINALGGYQALVMFKAGALLALAGFVLCFMWRGTKNTAARFAALALTTVIVAIMVSRLCAVRPHAINYLCVIVSLLILESRNRNIVFLLPPVAVLWCNMHGICYPLLLLICGAYFLQTLIDTVRSGERLGAGGITRLAVLGASSFLVLATPNGWDLLQTPFIPTDIIAENLKEFNPLSVKGFFSIRIGGMQPSLQTLCNAVLLAAAAALALGTWKRKINACQIILAAACPFLLLKGERFILETALLTAPLIKHGMIDVIDEESPAFPAWIGNILAPAATLAVMAVAIMFLKTYLWVGYRYPLSYRRLPVGNCEFLKKINTGGKVLHNANSGGYYQWMLYPSYRLTMDMQLPHLFSNRDIFINSNVFKDAVVCESFLAECRPDYITVTRGDWGILEFDEFKKNYAPVFFDDWGALYANRVSMPEIAKEYELKKLSPDKLDKLDVNLLGPDERAAVLNEAWRMAEVYPDGKKVNRVIAAILMRGGHIDKARPFIDNLLANHPEQPDGYILEGNALALNGRYSEAVDAFHQALKRCEKRERPEIHRKISRCHLMNKDYVKAEEHLAEAAPVFNPKTSADEILLLARLNERNGDIDKALFLYQAFLDKSPVERMEQRNQAAGSVRRLMNGMAQR